MSYEYLGKNVVPVALAKEIGRIQEKTVALGPAEEERAMRLHRESIVIDFHVHLTILPENLTEYDRLARSGRPATGFEGTRRSGLTGCLLAFAGSMVRRSSPAPWKFEDLVWDLGVRWADMDHRPDLFLRAYTAADIVRAKLAGRTAVLAMAENTQMVDNDLDRLDVLYGLGIRSLGLTYSARTTAGDGCNERTDAGLSRFGLKVVERMNRLGMLIDLSHSSPLASREAVEASAAPCCASHTFATALHDNPKGKSDDLCALIASKGGLIGVEAVPNVTCFTPTQSVFDVVDHVDYLVKLVGVDHVAIGTDCMFGDHVALHYAIAEMIGVSDEVHDLPATHMDYIENPGQWPNITRALVARGYADEDIRKIVGGNVLRLLEQTIG